MIELGTSKLFGSLPPAEFAPLAQSAEVKTYPDGQVIFQAGDPGDGVYVIGAGEVQISVMANPTEHRILTRLGLGDFFGEMAVLDNEPRSATAAAVGGTTLYFLPRAAMLAALNRSPSLAFSMVREFSLRTRDFNRHYLEEVLQAERLAFVGDRRQGDQHRGPAEEPGVARAHVAEHAGVERGGQEHDVAGGGAGDGEAGQERAVLAAADAVAIGAAVGVHRVAERIDEAGDRRQRDLGRVVDDIGAGAADVDAQLDHAGQHHRDALGQPDAGGAVLALTDYDAFVRQLAADLQPELDDKAVTLVWENPPPTQSLLLNPRRLAHAFANLMHNAIDAMPGGGKILLRFIVHDQQLVTEIEDTGPGIAPEVAAHLFEPFITFGKPHGTGLGLSICQRILGDHHGRIQARNRPGGGAIFSLSLPLPP